MAHTARNEEEKKEFFDSPEVLDKKASQMVDMIRSSKHFIVFTVSTYSYLSRSTHNSLLL